MTDGRPPRPDPLTLQPDAIPEALRERDQWVCWRYEWRDDEWTKLPVDATTGRNASSTDPETWTSLANALAYHDRNGTDTDGVGFVIHDEDLVAGLDLDDCRAPDTSDIEAWAGDVLEEVDTYAEVSPSGTGLRLFGFGFVPDGGNRGDVDGADGHIELYDSGRYLTVTGHAVDGAPEDVCQVNDAIADVHAEYIADDEPEHESPKPAGDGGVRTMSPSANPGVGAEKPASTNGPTSLDRDELLKRAKNAENGDYFEDLWKGQWKKHRHRWETSSDQGQSEADLALCGFLAFWTGGDRDRMDRLFRQSGLMRPKWDEDRGDLTYGERTIEKALEGCTEYYDPNTGTGSAPPAEAVDSDLVDALLDDPGEWIDADAREWTVRDTADHTADEIVAALHEGTLPGDADGALADAVLTGDVSDAVGDALKDWRQNPDAWSVTVARTIDDDELTPAAVAHDAEVDPEDLGDLPARVRAHHVWARVRRRDGGHIIARVGERADGALFSYDESAGVWRETGADDLRTLGSQGLDVAYSKRVGSELEERVRVTRAPGEPVGQVHIDEFGAPEETVPVANGLLDIADRDIRPLEPTDYALATLPVEYDPEADCPAFEDYLADVCPRSVDRKKLQEYVGYTLLNWALPFHKALFIAGPQASGKSTFLDVVHALLGDETTCSLAPQEFTTEQFAGYGLWGAWANIRSDIPADLIENTGKFKEVVAGDPVKVEKKYQDPITIEPTAKHLFAANTLPSADIDDDAFFRRILLVSFPNTIPRDERDPHLGDELLAELPGVLNWALDGLARLREQGHFSGDLPPEETQAKWRAWGESIERFKQRCVDEDAAATDYVPKHDLYDAYTQFCEAENIPAESSTKFGREIKDHPAVDDGQRTIDGERVWVYTGIDLIEDRVPSEGDDTGGQGGLHGF